VPRVAAAALKPLEGSGLSSVEPALGEDGATAVTYVGVVARVRIERHRVAPHAQLLVHIFKAQDVVLVVELHFRPGFAIARGAFLPELLARELAVLEFLVLGLEYLAHVLEGVGRQAELLGHLFRVGVLDG